MRLGFFLLVVAFTLAVSCYEFTDADPSPDSFRVIASTDEVHRNVKSPALRRLENAAAIINDKPTSAEDEERGFTKLKELFNKLPGLNRIKTLLGKNPSPQKVEALVAKSPELSKLKSAVGKTPIKVDAADVKKLEKVVEKKAVHPAITVAKSLLKMLMYVGAISLTVGAIVYINENYL